jgi:dipeptidyl aminopeptidase/acylaminoacyl peptidase
MKRQTVTLLAGVLALAVGLAAQPLATAQQAPRRFGFDDFSKVKRVGEPQFSPDGSSIAFIVSTPNLDENRHAASLHRIDVASGRTQTIVDGAKHVSVSFPRWSPDGQRIGFLATVPTRGSPRAQIFVIPGAGGEPKQITEAPRGVQQFAWSPDGRSIGFATEDEPEQKAGYQRWNDSFEVQPGYHLYMQAPVPPTHVWMVSSAGGEARRLTSGTWTLPVARPPGPPSSLITWTPDGREIVFARSGGGGGGLQAVSVADGTLRSLGTGGNFPLFSPDGKLILTGGGSIAQVGTTAPAQNPAQNLDRRVHRALWMPDGKSILIGGNDNERVSLWQQPIDGQRRKIDTGGVSPNSSFYVDMAVSSKGAIAFAGTSPSRPAELYYMPSSDAPVRKLTDVNAEIASIPLGKVEMLTYTFEKYEQNGVLVYPPDYDPAKKYPLVLVIHGGPAAASLLTFDPRAQIMAARGWLVFSPNYRGSDNLGGQFQRGINGDAGAGPGRDVMAGIEEVKKRASVDETRMGVSGWSYGGYMTTWMLGNYPDVWRAGVAGAAVTDRIDQQSFSDGAGRGGQALINEKNFEAERAQSPITYAGKIKAPTLILANTGDYRVPTTQSFKLYHALRAAGVPTRFIAYPIPGHNAQDPVRQRDVAERWVGWFELYFSDNPPPAASTGGRGRRGGGGGGQ